MMTDTKYPNLKVESQYNGAMTLVDEGIMSQVELLTLARVWARNPLAAREDLQGRGFSDEQIRWIFDGLDAVVGK